jgi:hypothetical protein
MTLRRLPVLFLACLAILTGCGDGGWNPWYANTGSGTGSGSSFTSNSVSVTVGAGVNNVINLPTTSVTLCAPGTSQCQTIDNVLVDTGSYGLRVMSSVLTLALTAQTASAGGTLASCATFADGYTWGSVRLADLRIGGESASNLPVQVIGDTAVPTVPTDCSGTGTAENTPQAFGANGVLGIGINVYDCGADCASGAIAGTYYGCTSGACTATIAPLAQQVVNPVTRFATDNNGSILTLPSVATGGEQTVTGTLTFGIGTQSNNALGSASVYTLDSSGAFTTVYGGTTYAGSFIDSGSNGLFFTDASIPTCSANSAFYCPASTLSLAATNTGANGTSGNVTFSVGNEATLLSSDNFAYANLAGPGPTIGGAPAFDWGLPFFYGRSVYTAIDGQATPAGNGPYYAY